MTPTDTLARLEELEKKATAGPWTAVPCTTAGMSKPNASRIGEAWDDYGYASMEDGQFIAAMRNAAPALIEVAKAAKEQLYGSSRCEPHGLVRCWHCTAAALAKLEALK